jgi:DNA-directed RNA polymerase specialized sigma24 family protein
VSGANLPHPARFSGYEESSPPGSRGELAAAGVYDELAAIASDPDMLRHARRVAGELAEDVLQETWYAVAQACARRSIGNPRGYFYRVMVNTATRMREEIARQGIPVEDPAAAARPCRSRDLAAASAESDALPRLLAAARRELLHRRQAELRQEIPACSCDPDRYREVILAVAEAMVVGEGPASRAEINDTLVAAYPQWFDAPDTTAATIYQRRCRAREDIRRVVEAMIGPDSF